jgi:hypothetical protein
MGGEAAGHVHDVELAMGVAGIGFGEVPHHLGGRLSLAQEGQPGAPVKRVHQGLRRQRSGARFEVGHARADGEELCGDRDADLAGAVVTGDDRPGHRSASGRVALHAARIGGRLAAHAVA